MMRAYIIKVMRTLALFPQHYVSNEKRAPGCSGYIGDEILPSYIYEFRFLMMSSSLCRIWTYESKSCTGLQSRKLAEAIFTFFNDGISRKCVLQDFVILSFTFIYS